MECQNYCFELQIEEMELAFCMGHSTRNIGIPHMGTPALCRGIRKDHELRLERSDRDTTSEKKWILITASVQVGWQGLVGLINVMK